MFFRFTPVFFHVSGFFIAVSSFFLFSSSFVFSQEVAPDTDLIGVEQKLGEFVDMDLEFTNSSGGRVSLGEVGKFNRPYVLVPVYFRCPGLCSFVLNGLVDLLNESKFRPGRDFDILTVSFNPGEGASLAKEKAGNYYKKLSIAEDGELGWHFLVGESENIDKLMNSIGFSYVKNGDEYAHSAVLVLVSAEGKISRYFADVVFDVEEFDRALVDAADGRIGSFVDKVFQFCFLFDPTKGTYTLHVYRLTQVFGIGLTFCVFWFLLKLWRFERKG